MNKQETFKAAVEQRIEEIAGYQLNIDNYTRMIANIAEEWDDDIAHYADFALSDIVSVIHDEVLLTRVADLLFKDKLIITLRTEKLEQRKAKMVLAVLQTQLEV
jgi:hypothetical protein